MLKVWLMMAWSYYKDYQANQRRYKKWQRKKRAFAEAKKLATLKHESTGRRFYIFVDKIDDSLLVMDKYQMNRIFQMTRRKFVFKDALWFTP